MFGLSAKLSNIAAIAAGGLVIVLLIALMITRNTLEKRTAERDKALSTLGICKNVIADQNSKIDAVRKMGDESAAAAIAKLQESGADRDKLQATIKSLQDSAAKHPPVDAGCKSSDAFKNAIGALP